MLCHSCPEIWFSCVLVKLCGMCQIALWLHKIHVYRTWDSRLLMRTSSASVKLLILPLCLFEVVCTTSIPNDIVPLVWVPNDASISHSACLIHQLLGLGVDPMLPAGISLTSPTSWDHHGHIFRPSAQIGNGSLYIRPGTLALKIVTLPHSG